MNYFRGEPISLSDADFSESQLQKLINDDPTILGLGELTLVQRERRQSAGGRLDFLLYDVETDTMFEVEVMLGTLDESHIIRAIEYWDIERRRWPNREHRAVIVAEEITNRFFNVIALFNRAIPMIAIQLNAIKVEDKIILNFTKVLDIYEPPEEETEPVDLVDREWWKNRSNPESLKIVDEIANLLVQGNKRPRITYNRTHIAMGGAKQNFGWFHPRKERTHCHIEMRVGGKEREKVMTQLEEVGIAARPRRDENLIMIITPEELKNHREAISVAFNEALHNVGGNL